MTHAIIFHPEADRELSSLYFYISKESGPERAWRYVREIRAFCYQLTEFPLRGTERTEIARGLRIIAYKRRCTIIFTVIQETVVILGIYYAGRKISSSTLRRRLRDR